MTDLNTHILPGMDDGARNVESSLKMLHMEQKQGVDTVVLTPSYYRDKERPASFLARREAACRELTRAVEQQEGPLPRLLPGAVVAWAPHLAEWPELPELCIQGTSNLLLEMPFGGWNDHTINEVYELINRRGITPIFAHLERYLRDQRPEYIEEILTMGAPVQLSAGPLLHFWDNRPLLKMIRRHQAHVLASGCHNLTSRPPNLKAGLDVVEKSLGPEEAQRLIRYADRLVQP